MSSDINYDEPAELPDDHADQSERVAWHVRMVSRLTAEHQDTRRPFVAELLRLAEELKQIDEQHAARVDWHSRPIEQYHRARLRRDPATPHTIKLPYGTSSIRVPRTPRIVIDDPEALTEWALSYRPDVVASRVRVSDLGRVAKCQNDGTVIVVGSDPVQVVPGVSAVIGEPTWSLRPRAAGLDDEEGTP